MQRMYQCQGTCAVLWGKKKAWVTGGCLCMASQTFELDVDMWLGVCLENCILGRGRWTCKGTEVWKQHIRSGKPGVVWEARGMGWVPSEESWSWDSWDGPGQILKDIVYWVQTWFFRWKSLEDALFLPVPHHILCSLPCLSYALYLLVLIFSSFFLSRGIQWVWFLPPLQWHFEMYVG